MSIENIFVSSSRMRLIDKKAIEEYKIPAETLMENAGRGCTLEIIEVLKNKYEAWQRKGVIVCGSGNNGGDGLVIARYLAEKNMKPRVFIFKPKDKYNELVSSNLEELRKYPLVSVARLPNSISYFEKEISNCDFVVDALLGTGAKGAPKGCMAEIINTVNESGKTVFSVDIPTGMDGDTGRTYASCIKADYTFTLGLNKKGFLNPASKTHTGKVKVIDIGFPVELIKEQETL